MDNIALGRSDRWVRAYSEIRNWIERHLSGEHSRGARSHYVLAAVTLILAAMPAIGFGAAPQLLLNINKNLAPLDSNPVYLGKLGGKLLFGARDGTGSGLWSTDGTLQGTVLIRRVQVFAQNSFPGTPNFAVVGGKGYFVGSDGTTGTELWSTDGTAAGTALVKDLVPGNNSGLLNIRGVFGSQVVF